SRKLLVLLALCLIGIIVAYRVWGADFNWSLFKSSLKTMNPAWLLASIGVTMGTYWFRAIRWQILLAPLKHVSLKSLFSITIIGFSAIFLLGRAGEVARPIWLARREKVALTGSVATIVVERFLDSIMLIIAFVIALALSDAPTASSPTLALFKNAAWFIAAVAAAAMVALFVLRSNGAWIVRKIPFRRVASLMDNFLQGLSFLQNGRSLALVVLQSVCLWMLIALQFWFMLLGMNFSLSPASATLVMVGAGIGSIAQIPAIGGGFQAGYVFCMTAFLRVPLEQAVATSLIAAALSFAPTIAIALVFMAAQGFSIRDLKARESEAL
ncbi:MAG TPA: lysylphosphatidylglycerol synthase transmembrane domain-containing protein, partial [Terriglobia bacterium]|nr:lysylphosphatidylglycerol synthase transmembrane domain-containing protein [Terriglobia bacterium]